MRKSRLLYCHWRLIMSDPCFFLKTEISQVICQAADRIGAGRKPLAVATEARANLSRTGCESAVNPQRSAMGTQRTTSGTQREYNGQRAECKRRVVPVRRDGTTASGARDSVRC